MVSAATESETTVHSLLDQLHATTQVIKLEPPATTAATVLPEGLSVATQACGSEDWREVIFELCFRSLVFFFLYLEDMFFFRLCWASGF